MSTQAPVTVQSLSPSEIFVECADGRLHDWRETLSRKIPGSEYSKKHRDHPSNRRLPPHVRAQMWDGRTRPGKYLRQRGQGHIWRGGRGLLASLQRHFGEVQGEVTQPPFLHMTIPDSLRDYQKEGLQLIAQYHWGRLALATNAGKGAIIALAAKSAADLGMRVLILCASVSVFDALEGEIEKWGKMRVGKISEGVKEIPEERVCIAMVQTLVRRIRPEWANSSKKRRANPTEEHKKWREWLEGVQMSLLDEADLATSDEWQYILDRMPNNLWRIGFSGSFPLIQTTDHVVLEETIGPVLSRVRNLDLVGRKISARPQVFLMPFRTHVGNVPRELSGAARRHWVYEQAVIFNAERHEFIRRILPKNVQNAIVVHRVAHGEQLAMVIPDSKFVYGDTPKPERLEILESFERGEFQNLIVTSILDRGSNRLGKVRGLVFAANEGSSRQVLQRIGRGLRKGDGKENLFLFDIADTGHKYLENAVQKRLGVYAREGFDVRVERK